jgi:electron-transferring-flavoprotein dehydrogenase
MADGLVSLGLVIGLDYANPYLSPYRELQVGICSDDVDGLLIEGMQRLKHHPYFTHLLSGDSTRIAYGGRALNEGGLQSLPTLHFPGGALIGCSAGFLNVAKIKGTHTAMKSGMLAAEAAFNLIQQSSEDSQAVQAPADMSAYATAFKNSWVHSELHEIRNLRPSFNTPLGIFGGIAYSGVDSLLLKGRTPWTFRNHSKKNDAQHTGRAANFKPIEYPAPVPPLSTDLLTALVLTGTNHAEDQTVHLRVTGPDGQETPEIRSDHVRRNVEEFAGLLGRACPAGVYEYVEASEENNVGGWNGHKLVINSQVCVFSLELPGLY